MSDTSKDVRKKILGRAGEKAVVEFLKKRGLKILQKNYVTPFGEADIVAEDAEKGEIAFIEVKTRSGDGYGSPAEAVGAKNGKGIKKSPRFIGFKRGENRTRASTWRKCLRTAA